MSAIKKPSTTHGNTSCQPDQSLLVFPLAGEWFGLPLASVRAVFAAGLLRTLPGSLDSLAGWIELQGQEILVLDMTQTLVPGAVAAAAEQIILLRVGDSLAGLITTGISETISLPAGHLGQVSDTAGASDWSLGVCRADGRTITMLNPEMFAGSLCTAS